MRLAHVACPARTNLFLYICVRTFINIYYQHQQRDRARTRTPAPLARRPRTESALQIPLTVHTRPACPRVRAHSHGGGHMRPFHAVAAATRRNPHSLHCLDIFAECARTLNATMMMGDASTIMHICDLRGCSGVGGGCCCPSSTSSSSPSSVGRERDAAAAVAANTAAYPKSKYRMCIGKCVHVDFENFTRVCRASGVCVRVCTASHLMGARSPSK